METVTPNPPNHHKSPISPTIFIVSLIAISAAALLAAIWIIFMLRKLHKSGQSTDPESRASSASHAELSPAAAKLPESKNAYHKGVQVFAYRELAVATGNFANENIMSKRRNAVVYRGVVGESTLAAIKMLRREGKQGERSFRVEVDLFSRLQSVHLVELLGYCADSHHRALVLEYMPNGTLEHHLHGGNDRSLDWMTRLRIALDCAMALEYLHEHSPAVIHRDFTCRSILLDEMFHAKVLGLGLARVGSEKVHGQVATRVLGTTGYLAPEYASTGKLTTKSDVYSYGVVLLELLTGRKPVDSLRPPGEHVLVSWALPRLTNREMVEDMIDPVLVGRCLRKELIQVAAVAAMCVQPEADYRPLMTDVVQSLIPLVKNSSPFR